MKKIFSLIVIFSMVSSLSTPSFAADGSWISTGAASPSWGNIDNWNLAFVPGATTGTTDTDIATFNAAIQFNNYGTSANPVIIDPARNIGGINFDTAADNYFIGSTSLNPLLLTSAGTIQILNTLTATDAIETINAPLVIEGASGTYTFANNSANGTGAGAGTLNFGGEITGGTSGATVLTLSGSNANSNTISGVIANGSATSVAVNKTGVGTWVLSGANTYTGTTTVSAGTLEAGAVNQAFGVGSAVTVGSGATLDLGGFNETIGSLAGAGTVTSNAAGTPILTTGGNNSSTTFSGAIQDGVASVGLTKEGTGTLTLSGANTYSGDTSLDAGTLNLGSGTAIGAGTINFNGGTLQYSASNTTDYSSQFSTAAGQAFNIDTNGQAVTLATALDSTGGTLTKIGSGTLTLTANSSYDGLTTISGGSLQIGSGGATGSLGTGNVTDNANLTFDLSNSPTVSNNISGTGSVTQNGTGTVTLSGTNTYGGGTTVNAGTLTATGSSALGATTGTLAVNNPNTGAGTDVVVNLSTTAPTTTGSLSGTIAAPNSGTNTATINNGGELFTVNQTANGTYAGVIAGTGGFTLGSLSTSTLTLSGDNTYGGATSLDAGTLNLGSGTAIGAGTINFNGGTLQYSASNTIDYSSQFSTAAGQAFNIDTNGQAVTLATALDSTGGTLTKIGSGTLTLTANSSYDGLTTISGGSLQIGSGGATGSLGTGNVTDNANLTFDLSNSPTVSNNISGTGSVTQNGTGTVTLSGTNTYTGVTTVSAGTLEAGAVTQAFGVGSAVTVGVSGTLDLGGLNETVGSLAGAGTVTSGAAGTPTLTTGGNNSSTTFSGVIGDGSATSVGLTKEGSGTFTLSGPNTYTGVTTLNSGIINLGVAETVGVSGPLGLSIANNPGSIVLNGGYLQYSAANQNDYSGRFSTGNDQQYNVDTNGQDVTWATALTSSGGSLTKTGAGVLTLSNVNTYDGGTTVNGGTLTATGSSALGATTGTLAVNNPNTGAGTDVVVNLSTTAPTTTGSLSGTIAAPSSGTNTATINNGGELFTVNQTANGTYAGVIAGTGGFILGNFSDDTLTLNGDDTYSGGTTISAGKLQVGNTNALGTGDVTNNATLVLGTTSLSVGGVYTQSPGSTLSLTADSDSSYGQVVSAVAASVAAASTVNVTLGGYVSNNAVLEIINTGGAGVGAAPSTVTTASPFLSFASSILNGNLYLTAENTTFVSLADNPNARALGTVLDNVTNPSSDFTNVLNTLQLLSDAKITSALNTMGPIVDGGIIQNSSAALNNFIGTTLDRVQTVLSRQSIIDDSLNKAENNATAQASTGDQSEINGLWAKPYGSYLNQGTLQGIQGYDAWNAGTVIGVDRLITDNFTVGVSGGYAYGQVDSDINNATTDIDSAQGTIYAGYQDPNYNYFLDAAGSFAWDWYDAQRDIEVGNIDRTADSNYDGQQFGTYLGGGYKFNFGYLEFTPLASIQWTHLDLDSYTETHAGSLDLNVDSQTYDTLESGLGASVSYPEPFTWGDFTPEFHVKWLHDFIDDAMSVTSTFTGGGGSFTTNGATPSKNGVDIGSKLSFDFNNELSLIAEADAELRDGFFGIYGSGTVRCKF